MAKASHIKKEASPGLGAAKSTGTVKARVGLAASSFIIAFACSVALSMVIPPPVLHRDMHVKQEATGRFARGDGLVNPPDFAYGLLDPETRLDGTTQRWTTGHATVPFPYAAHYGRHAEVVVRMSGMREPGQPPADVTLSLNGKPVSRLSLNGSSYETHSITLDTAQTPNPYLHPADVQLDIQSTTIPVPGSDKQRGVALDWIEVRPTRSRSEIVAEAGVWALLAALALSVAATRLSLGWGVLYGLAALGTFALVHLTYVPRAVSPTVEAAPAGLAWILAAWLAPRRAPVWGLPLALLGLWVVVGGRALVDWEVDDAYISYRYALNLVEGHGLVYNPGEVVEGYTNFLWTMLAAGGMLLGRHPATVALAATIACAVCLLGLCYYLGCKLAGGQCRWAWLSAGLLAVDAGFVTYGPKGSGLETMAFALLVLLAVALRAAEIRNQKSEIRNQKSEVRNQKSEIRSQKSEVSNLIVHRPSSIAHRPSPIVHRPSPIVHRLSSVVHSAFAGVALALASLTRPEGLMVAALLPAVRAWQDRRAGRQAWKPLAATLLPFLGIVVPYQIWRLTFYGYPFPNTFYAKTGTSIEQFKRGLEYTWNFAVDHWLVVALALAGLLMAVARLWASRRVTMNSRGEWGHPTPRQGRNPPNPQPLTPNPQPLTPNPQPLTPNPQPLTPNPQPLTPNPQPLTPNPQPLTPNPHPKGHPTPRQGRTSAPPSSYAAAELRVTLALLVALFTLYIVGTGGDWATGGRFFVPIAAPLALLSQEAARLGLARLRPNRTLWGAGAVALSALVVGYVAYALWLQRPDGALAERTLKDTYKLHKWSLTGVWLRDNTPPQATVAASPAGGMAYYSRRYVTDMFGLNDLHIGHLEVANMGSRTAGHEKMDPEYVLAKKPDYMLRYDQWYFAGTPGRLESQYEVITSRTPGGYETAMLRRKGAAGK